MSGRGERGSILLRLLNDFVANIVGTGEGRNTDSGDVRQRIKEHLINQLSTADFSGKASLARSVSDAVVRGLASSGMRVMVLEARLASRGKVGASGSPLGLVFETGVAWDLVYDLPYIPGSSIKGAVRGFWEALQDERRCRNDERLKRAFTRLFGSPCTLDWKVEGKERGALVFMDSYPTALAPNGGLIEPSVLTPHYHRGGDVVEKEADASPVPILHPTIASGVTFTIIVSFPGVPASLVSDIESDAERIIENASPRLGDLPRIANSLLNPVYALVALPLVLGSVGAKGRMGLNFFEIRRGRLIG